MDPLLARFLPDITDAHRSALLEFYCAGEDATPEQEEDCAASQCFWRSFRTRVQCVVQAWPSMRVRTRPCPCMCMRAWTCLCSRCVCVCAHRV
eukprot:4861948-Alexandrium_andersonii.AAC.1